MPYSERLAEVLNDPDGILAGQSGNQIVMKVAVSGGNISAATAIRTKKGIYGEEGTLRAIGRAYADKILERWGDEVEAAMGERTTTAAVEWLLSIANEAWVLKVDHIQPHERRAQMELDMNRIVEPFAGSGDLIRAVEEAGRKAAREVLDKVQFGRFESPQQKAVRWVGAATMKYGALGATIPTGRAQFSGGNFKTEDDARAAVLAWLENLQHQNPGIQVSELEEGLQD